MTVTRKPAKRLILWSVQNLATRLMARTPQARYIHLVGGIWAPGCASGAWLLRVQVPQGSPGGTWLKSSLSSSLGRSVKVLVLEEQGSVGGPRALSAICHGGCHWPRAHARLSCPQVALSQTLLYVTRRREGPGPEAVSLPSGYSW
jgi:hypothetical protein